MKKILYVFTGGRRQRLNEILAGKKAPQEFLFGVPYLIDKGHKVDILELSELTPHQGAVAHKCLKKKNNIIARITGLSSCSHFFNESTFAEFNDCDIVVAGNEYIAFGLSHYKKKRILKSSSIFFVMGMLAKLYNLQRDRLRYMTGKYYYKQLIRSNRRCVFLGIGEYNFACKLFSSFKDRFEFLRYPVDTLFWCPGQVQGQSKYILFMGNDEHRDYELALRISKEMKEYNFRFITKRVSQDLVSGNVELISGDWRKSIISDIEVREIIRNSSIVILPLKETLQPSGQSVCQQAMSCGKSVIITRTKGFWSPGDFVNRKHLYFVENNQVREWCKVINELMSDDMKSQNLGINARKLMEEKFNIIDFGKALKKIITES